MTHRRRKPPYNLRSIQWPPNDLITLLSPITHTLSCLTLPSWCSHACRSKSVLFGFTDLLPEDHLTEWALDQDGKWWWIWQKNNQLRLKRDWGSEPSNQISDHFLWVKVKNDSRTFLIGALSSLIFNLRQLNLSSIECMVGLSIPFQENCSWILIIFEALDIQ